MFFQRLGHIHHPERIELPMSLQECDPRLPCGRHLANGACHLVLQVVDRAVHHVRIRRPQLCFEQLYGNDPLPVRDERSREYDAFGVGPFLPEPDAAVGETLLLQIVVHLIPGLLVGARIGVHERVVDAVRLVDTHLVQ